MANRKHVVVVVAAVLLLCFVSMGCTEEEPTPTENRGRVIDQDTGLGVPEAIVVGRYMGSRRDGSSSCNRIESAVSDAEGWFTLPLDPDAGVLLMEAYHEGYYRGKSPRHAFNGAEDDPKKWQVQILRWDENNRNGTTERIEPPIYRSEGAALLASRERMDVYVRRTKASGTNRSLELGGVSGSGICGGGARVTDGAIPFLEAIHQEYLTLGYAEAQLESIRSMTESAASANRRARSRTSK